MSRHTSKAGKLCHGKVTQLGTNPWWTAGNVNSPITCFECPDNNAYPKTELHKALIKMFNPLLSLQMAWADNKLTNSFWYIIHDLFSFSGNFLFLSKKKNKPAKKPAKNPQSNTRKNSNYCKIIWNLKHLAFPLWLACWISNTTTWAMYGNFSAGPEHLNDLWRRRQQGCACSGLVSKGPQATEHRVCIT